MDPAREPRLARRRIAENADPLVIRAILEPAQRVAAVAARGEADPVPRQPLDLAPILPDLALARPPPQPPLPFEPA